LKKLYVRKKRILNF